MSDGYFTIEVAPTYYLNEDFEGSLEGWTTGQSRPWTNTTNESYSGSHSMMSGTVSNDSETSYLYTEVSTPMYGSVTVSYYLWVDCPAGGGANATFKLYVQGNNSLYWSELYLYSGYMDNWQQKTSTINLNGIATPPTIKWEFSGGYSSCKCYVDLVRVY